MNEKVMPEPDECTLGVYVAWDWLLSQPDIDERHMCRILVNGGCYLGILKMLQKIRGYEGNDLEYLRNANYSDDCDRAMFIANLIHTHRLASDTDDRFAVDLRESVLYCEVKEIILGSAG